MNSLISVEESLPKIGKEVLLYVAYKDAEMLIKRDGHEEWYQPRFCVGELCEDVFAHDPDGKHNFWRVPIEGSNWKIQGWSYFFVPDVLYWCELPEVVEE